MRWKEAVAALQIGRKKTEHHQLITPFGEQVDPHHVLEEYPRPQMRRAQWVNLNGYWEYAITEDQQRPQQADGRILVPFSPETTLSEVGRQLLPGQYLWYFKTFTLHEIPEGKRLLLQFGAVDQDCVVYLNQKRVGGHLGGYLAFTMDLTPYVHEGSNELTVKVRDETNRGWMNRGKQSLEPGGMFYTAQSGIWQTVWMEWVPKQYISELKITPLYDEQKVRVTIRMAQEDKPCHRRITVREDSRYPGTDGAPGSADCGERWAEPGSEHGPGGKLLSEMETTEETLELSLSELHSWSPERPYLYQMTVQAGDDLVESYFGMRKFTREKDARGISRLFLNGKPYFQDGVLDQGYWPESLYTPPSDEALIFDILAMKRFGFNMLRKHLKVECARWYYHCDRLGMLVWQDMVNGGGRSLKTFLLYLPTVLPVVTTDFSDSWYPLFSRTSKTGRSQWLHECRETIHQLYNAPCIALWTPFNEGWGQFDAAKVTDMIRKEDATRPVDHASGWYDQGAGDIKSVHNYFRYLEVRPEERAYAFSEYGGYTCRVEGHSCSDRVFGYGGYPNQTAYSAAMNRLREKIHALEADGLAAAVFTQLSDVEEEVNGILTYDRRVCKWESCSGAAPKQSSETEKK